MNRIEYGDCRELMRAWPDGIADACITDPPYGDTSLNWDRRVDGWVEQVSRVLKPSSSVWVFGSMRYLVTVFAEMERAGFRYSQDVVWEKQNGTGFHADRFRRVHEHAAMFYRGQWRDVYHDPQYTMDATARYVRRKTSPAHTGRIEAGHYASHDGGPRLARSVLKVRNEHGRAVHPTQKPEELVSTLIAYSVPQGGLVIDPFMGSGTTAAAAANLGRAYLGCELSLEYQEIHESRLKPKPINGDLFEASA